MPAKVERWAKIGWLLLQPVQQWQVKNCLRNMDISKIDCHYKSSRRGIWMTNPIFNNDWLPAEWIWVIQWRNQGEKFSCSLTMDLSTLLWTQRPKKKTWFDESAVFSTKLACLPCFNPCLDRGIIYLAKAWARNYQTLHLLILIIDTDIHALTTMQRGCLLSVLDAICFTI